MRSSPEQGAEGFVAVPPKRDAPPPKTDAPPAEVLPNKPPVCPVDALPKLPVYIKDNKLDCYDTICKQNEHIVTGVMIQYEIGENDALPGNIIQKLGL